MKNLIIIGAGGMGRTIFNIAQESLGFLTTYIVKGFINDIPNALDGFIGYPPIIDSIVDYTPSDNDVFINAIGAIERIGCINQILNKGGNFINLIHKTARIGTNVKIGVGNIIGPFTTLGPDVRIGNYNMLQSYTVIGHDAIIGNYNRIDTHVTCVGGIKIENETTIHTSAVINHKVTIHDRATIGACSFVIRNVKENQTVFGIPAKKLN